MNDVPLLRSDFLLTYYSNPKSYCDRRHRFFTHGTLLQPDLRLRRLSKNSQEILAYKFLLLILLIPIDNPNTGWLQC
ncbi:hypothetical protein T09_12298 [Trichinella sp. T9]|nr:hypothetical protein T09_12298 [Trichinella sp. T9]